MVDAPSVLVHVSAVQTDGKLGQYRNLMIESLVGERIVINAAPRLSV